MIFADKLIKLRKKMGLTQEDLASKLDVGKEVVLNWEKSEVLPDVDKIIKLSFLFNVSTDYLIKDEIEVIDKKDDNLLLGRINDFLSHTKKIAFNISLGIVLCILSPLMLIILSILSDKSLMIISPTLAVILGVLMLFISVLIAVILFVTTSFKEEKYKYINVQDFLTFDMGVRVVQERKYEFKNIYNGSILIGVILCILSPLSLIICAFFDNLYLIALSLIILFLMVAIAVFLFVFASIRLNGFEKLLYKEGQKMEKNKRENIISRIIWLVATIIYLSISLIFGYWHLTWIVWIIAALVQAIVFILYQKD